MPIIVIYVTAGMLIAGIFPLPYGYYTLLRLVATTVFLWAAVIAFNRNEKSLPWLFAILAFLFNPIISIYLPKILWMIIDGASALILIVTRAKIQEKT